MDIAWSATDAEREGAEPIVRFGPPTHGADRVAGADAEESLACLGAADSGDVLAPFSLGSCYFGGAGDRMAPLEVVLWSGRAADCGTAEFRNHVGFLDGSGDRTAAARPLPVADEAEADSDEPPSGRDSASAVGGRVWVEF